jgi:glycosyltransferase involved in cell wall biosynthesis
MKNKPKISALLISYNEEKFIREFIISMDFVDELIIVDSFSTDKTIDIIKEFSHIKLFQRKFDDFSSQKNFTIEKATNDWIIFFDADERMTPPLKNEILETVSKNAKEVAYWVYRTNIYMNKEVKYSGWQNDKVIRLFKKEFCRYDGKLVHEEIEAKGKVGALKNKLKHHSYKGFDNIIQKRNIYAQFQAQELYMKGFKPNIFHFLIKPIFRFFKHFVIKLGFLDGFRGFIISFVYAYTVFIRYVKLVLLRKNIVIPKQSSKDFPIDAVITWVDGSDKKHQQKMKPYYKGKNDWKNEKFRTRFNQVNEIEYAVKSIIKFAPYIQNIFIVTDEQTPLFIENYYKEKEENHPEIKIIDHKEIFVEHKSFLPVFNCRPIETMLYRIPNLSEHFIYMNDDFTLFKKTIPSDFFKNGLPVLRGKWTRLDETIIYKRIYDNILKLFGKPTKNNKYGYKRGQQNAARKIGFVKRYFRIDHTPAPIRKSTLANYYEKNPEIQQLNIKHRFRNPEQYVLQSLVNHLELKKNTCFLTNEYQLLYMGSYKKSISRIKDEINKSVKNQNILFLCLQSLDKCPNKKLIFLLSWLNNHLSINK